jgi:hypothetical protein
VALGDTRRGQAVATESPPDDEPPDPDPDDPTLFTLEE